MYTNFKVFFKYDGPKTTAKVCLIDTDTKEVFEIANGSSTCGAEDVYNKQFGKKLALQRALSTIVSTKLRKIYWDLFNNKK